MKLLSKLLAVAAVAVAAVSAKSPSCLDDNGKPVDHFHILKGPHSNDTWTFDGKDMTKSKVGMGGMKGAIPYTVTQIYDKMPKSHAFALYNDDTDDQKSAASHAHAKGVIYFDGTQGFWLIHSLPRYPSQTKYGYRYLPDNRYGQSFVCLTLKASNLEDIGNQLTVMWPQIYDQSISNDLAKKYPTFADWLGGAKTKTPQSTLNLKTKAGQNFTHFAKGKLCKCETYQDVIAPGLNSDLQVETWMNGALANKIPTTCKGKKGAKYTVEDVATLETSDGSTWGETQDHSKWAITKGAKTFTCYGDTNRQASQAKRGGGSMCMNDKKLHSAMSDLVQTVSNPCK